MLEVKNLMVFFENALALNDFSMEIREGEIDEAFIQSAEDNTPIFPWIDHRVYA